MRTLLLLRHAKSSWDEVELDDFERPLSARGRADAPAMGEFMRHSSLVPDVVLCSPARRAMETWELVEEALSAGPDIEFERDLYMASPSSILRLVQSQPLDYRRVLVVAHNPGLEELATRLCSGDTSDAFVHLKTKYPTGALAEIEFEDELWGEIDWGGGKLLRFVRPADL